MNAPRLLRTRVARRILAVFLVCAVLPVATFAVLGYAVIAGGLEDRARELLRHQSKSAGLVLFDRLQMLSTELTRVGLSGAGGSAAGDFTRVMLQRGDGGVQAIAGRAGAIPRLSSRQETRVAEGLPLLLRASDSGAATLTLVMRDPTDGSGRSRLLGTFPASLLLGMEEGQSPAATDTELCVLDATRKPLLCPNAEAARAAASDDLAPGVPPGWRRGDSLFVMNRWTLFLGNGFGTPTWTVALSMPENAIFAPLAVFRRVSLLSVALAALLVFFLSHVQLRKRMTPLAELESGVLRIRSGDFSVPVVIRSQDEFEVLADSFNGMAHDLQKQFSTLRALHVVDLAALEIHSAEAIADAALRWAPELLDSEMAAVAFADPANPGRWIVLAQAGHGEQRTRTNARPSPAELQELGARSKFFRLEGDGPDRSYAELPGVDPAGERLVFPILQDQKVRAALVIGRGNGAPYSPEAIDLGRQLADQLAVGLSNVALLSELSALSEGSMLALARTIDANSPWTAGHSERVTKGAQEIGRRLGLDSATLDRLRRGGLLHDIGKIGVPTAILDKAGPLTAEERLVIQSHTTIGAEIIRPIAAFQDLIPLVRNHHELLDGSGYPDKLAGDDIPLLVRILTVADIFDALVSDRPYRPGLSPGEALTLLQEGSGRRYDAGAVRALTAAVAEGWCSVAPERRSRPPAEEPHTLELVT